MLESTSPDVARSGFVMWCATTTELLPSTGILLKALRAAFEKSPSSPRSAYLRLTRLVRCVRNAAAFRLMCVCLLVTMRAPASRDCARSLAPKVACASAMASTTSLCSAEAALSIAIMGKEGACGKLLTCADVVVTNVFDAFDLLLRTERLRATLRG